MAELLDAQTAIHNTEMSAALATIKTLTDRVIAVETKLGTMAAQSVDRTELLTGLSDAVGALEEQVEPVGEACGAYGDLEHGMLLFPL